MQHHHASHCPLTSCFCFWMSLDSPGGEEPHDRCQKPCLQSNLQAGVESYWGYRTGPERRPWGSPWSTIDVDFNLIRIYRCFWAWSLFTTQKDTFGKFTTIQNLIHWTDLQWLGFRASNNKIQISVEKGLLVACCQPCSAVHERSQWNPLSRDIGNQSRK